MHLLFFARGINQQVELWKILAQSQFFRLPRFIKKTKKTEYKVVQGALRPSVFGAWEYIFPRAALPEVLAMFGITSNISYGFSKFGLELRHLLMREFFNCEKIDDKILKQAEEIMKKKGVMLLQDSERALSNCIIGGVALHIIGIKEDRDQDFGEFVQEAI